MRPDPQGHRVSSEIRAAGGVVWRPAAGGVGEEVVLVHRPRYDDWSLPKGKLESGEHPLAAAVREVREETGVHAVPQLRLPTVRYPLPVDNAEKVVDYWSMRAGAVDSRPPDHEVDQVRWVPADRAAALLTHDSERVPYQAYLLAPRVDGLVLLIRHARAGARGRYPGPDSQRPLEPSGVDDVDRLAGVVRLFLPGRLVSATVRRCVQTLTALGTGLPIETDGRFDDDSDPATAAAAIRELAKGPTAVVCSQGQLIPRLLAVLTGGDESDYRIPKGDGWLLAFAGGDLAGTDRLYP
jgi:8-oxo-dGTP diphosphatase